ncbi:unnamed protein product, partial [Discosporangium mesarthrocarpum]
MGGGSGGLIEGGAAVATEGAVGAAARPVLREEAHHDEGIFLRLLAISGSGSVRASGGEEKTYDPPQAEVCGRDQEDCCSRGRCLQAGSCCP